MSSVEETLAWEAEQRPRAGIAAVVAGVLTLAANLLLAVAMSDVPNERDDPYINVVESLSATLAGREPADPSLAVRHVEALGDKAAVLVTSSVVAVISVLLAAFALHYLDRATRARRPETGRAARIAIVAAAVLYPVGHLVYDGARYIGAAGFDGTTAEDARDVLLSPVANAGAILEYFGTFALALAFMLVALNAMKVGLLTRLWGILGVVVGVLAVFQLDRPQFLRAIWLVAVGLLVLERWPGGVPPAWRTGRAEPWPTQQELRERRAALEGGGGAGGTTPAEPAPAGAGEGYDSGKARRKRKRRR